MSKAKRSGKKSTGTIQKQYLPPLDFSERQMLIASQNEGLGNFARLIKVSREQLEKSYPSLEPLLDGLNEKPSSTKPRTSGSRQRRRQGTGD